MTLAPNLVERANFRRVDRVRGLVIVSVAFAACLVASAWVRKRSTPTFSAPPEPPSPLGVVGFPAAIDVVKTLPRARQLTPRNLFRGIVAEGVKSDGLVDIGARGHVRYMFQSLEGEGPQALREPGALARRPSCGRQTVVIRKEGMQVELDAPDAGCPVRPVEPLPAPRCGPPEIWQHAIGRGASAERPARIEYYRAQAGPAWRFDAPHPRGRFVLLGDCEHEIEGHDAQSAG